MQSGIAQQFRYQLGKNRFQIVPAAVEQAEADRTGRQSSRDDVRPARADRQRVAAAGAGGADELPSLELPDGICFEPALDEPLAVAAPSEEGWSDPIVFYPNGRTKNAQIRIKGERNTVVDVSLRGLTGVATAGKPRHEEELR